MKIYKDLTRDEMTNELVTVDVESMNWPDVGQLLRDGCKGYDNMTDEELIDCYKEYIEK